MTRFDLKFLKNKTVHFVGIGGISMSALALILKANGVVVQGSDECENAEVKKLKKKNIKVFVGHSKHNLKGVNIVVYSSAISETNEELQYAISKGMFLIKRAELLGVVASGYKTIVSVAGSHGKTTATAMIAEILMLEKSKPTIHLGGVLNKTHSNVKIGNKKIFLTESCEYKDNFLFLKPDISVVLNIDADHLDYFGNLDGVKQSFIKFIDGTKPGGINIACYDDFNSSEIINRENTVSFGFDKGADVYATKIKEYKTGMFAFDVVFFGYKLGRINLNIIGKHNILNALAAITVCLVMAIDFCDIKIALENFCGVERRCEKIAEINGAQIYHDYAHHPKQIESMIAVAKTLVKNNGRVIVVFEPHTFSRTKFLVEEFAKSFEKADHVIFAPVYSARECESAGFNSDELASYTKKYNANVECKKSFKEIKFKVLKLAQNGDVVLVLGAGTVEKLARSF